MAPVAGEAEGLRQVNGLLSWLHSLPFQVPAVVLDAWVKREAGDVDAINHSGAAPAAVSQTTPDDATVHELAWEGPGKDEGEPEDRPDPRVVPVLGVREGFCRTPFGALGMPLPGRLRVGARGLFRFVLARCRLCSPTGDALVFMSWPCFCRPRSTLLPPLAVRPRVGLPRHPPSAGPARLATIGRGPSVGGRGHRSRRV